MSKMRKIKVKFEMKPIEGNVKYLRKCFLKII